MTELLLSLLLYFTTPTAAQPIQEQTPNDLPAAQTTQNQTAQVGDANWNGD
ncbi:MAG: hypothetical protein ACFB0B_16855 [Thermonemataceae bacterium]